jgi:hypothetical protein
MSDWKDAQAHPEEALARLHFFSTKKRLASGEIELRITVREYATAEVGDLLFFAEADCELNQKTAPFRPCGWSKTLEGALAECMRNIRRFEYEEPRQASAKASE